MKQEDLDGTISYTQDVEVDVTQTDIVEEAPKEIRLLQNYPQPVQPLDTVEDLRIVLLSGVLQKEKGPGVFRAFPYLA